jgi:hypothetical protein
MEKQRTFDGFVESFRKFPDNLHETYLVLNVSPKYVDLCFLRADGAIQYLTSKVKTNTP